MTNERLDEILAKNKNLENSFKNLQLANQEINTIIEEYQKRNIQLVVLIERERAKLESLEAKMQKVKEQNEDGEKKLQQLFNKYDEKFKELNESPFGLSEKTFALFSLSEQTTKHVPAENSISLDLWLSQMFLNLKNIKTNHMPKESVSNLLSLIPFIKNTFGLQEHTELNIQDTLNQTFYHNQSLLQTNNQSVNKGDSHYESLKVSDSSGNFDFKNSLKKLIKETKDQKEGHFSISNSHSIFHKTNVYNNITDLFTSIIKQQWDYILIISLLIRPLKRVDKKLYYEVKQQAEAFWIRRKSQDKAHIQVFQQLFLGEDFPRKIKDLQEYIQKSQKELLEVQNKFQEMLTDRQRK